MNVRIFLVRVMKCMCAKTRPWFILSSERVFGGMEFEPMLTPREKSPLPENVPRGGLNPRRCGQQAQALPTEIFRPPLVAFKSAIEDFLQQSPHCAANRLQHIRSSGPGAVVCKSRATHRALITCNMSCYVPRGTN